MSSAARATDVHDAIAMNKQMYDTGQFSDITLSIDGTEKKLHKSVLVSCDYFRGMLDSEFQEATTGVVKMEVAEGSSVQATLLALEYVYTRDVELDGDSVMEVLAAADKLQLTKLKRHCVVYLENDVQEDNVCMLFRASKQLGLAQLEEQCDDFILRNAAAVFKSDGVKHLPKDVLLAMLGEDGNLDVAEEVVFEAVAGWCDANKDGGASAKDEFAAFLPSIRFAAMSHVFLQKQVLSSGLVSKDVVLEAVMAQLDSKAAPGAKRALDSGGEEASRKIKRRRRGHDGAVTWQRVVGMRAEGEELEKIGGNVNWNAGCSSVETITRSEERQWVEWTAVKEDQTYSIGLSHQDTDVCCLSIEYGVGLYSEGECCAGEKESDVSDYLGYAAGDRFKIVVTGDTVTYERNDQVFHTFTKKPTFPLLIDTSFRTPGATATNVKLHTVV